jgi:hypothetical protein
LIHTLETFATGEDKDLFPLPPPLIDSGLIHALPPPLGEPLERVDGEEPEQEGGYADDGKGPPVADGADDGLGDNGAGAAEDVADEVVDCHGLGAAAGEELCEACYSDGL